MKTATQMVADLEDQLAAALDELRKERISKQSLGKNMEEMLVKETHSHFHTRSHFATLGLECEDLRESLWWHRMVMVGMGLVCIFLGVLACR